MTKNAENQNTEHVAGDTNKSERASRRTLIGAVPATGITFGLFLAMNAMISVDGEPAEDTKEFKQVKITPQSDHESDEPRKRMPVKRIAESSPPPELPRHTIHKVTNFVPGAETIGKAPERTLREGAVIVDIAAINISKKAVPIGPLNVVYPTGAISRGIEGNCEVRFDLNPQGEAYNIQPVCTHSIFELPAQRAVSKARFSPRVERGVLQVQKGMLYPIEFKLEADK